MLQIINWFRHYIGAVVILLVLYFGASNLIDKYHHEILTGNTVTTRVESQPTNKVTAAIGDVAELAKDRELIAALSGQVAQLSAAQQTVAGAITHVAGVQSAMADALAAGLTKPSPKQQVLTVGTQTQSKLDVAAIKESDTQIQKDLKQVLMDPGTVIHTKVDTTVKVSYEDKPFSPVFAMYGAHGESGAGYTLRHTPLLDLDALLVAGNTAHPDNTGIAAGVGVEHVFKGTSAGLGISETFNFTTHKPATTVYAAIHF